MKLTNKVLLLILISSLIYIKFLRFNIFLYLLFESMTVGMYLILLTIYEAWSIKDCEKDFKEYQKRQKRIVNKI